MKKIVTLLENITPLPTPCAIDAVVNNEGYLLARSKYYTVLIAFAWLDAQIGIKGFKKRDYGTNQMIGSWANHHVSRRAIRIAARLHPRIKGDYPHFNISSMMVCPDHARIDGMTLERHVITPYCGAKYTYVEVLR